MKVWMIYDSHGEWVLEEVEETGGRADDSRGWVRVFYDKCEAIAFYRKRVGER